MLPKNVDPKKREEYLSEEDFKDAFGVTKDEFFKMSKKNQDLYKEIVF